MTIQERIAAAKRSQSGLAQVGGQRGENRLPTISQRLDAAKSTGGRLGGVSMMPGAVSAITPTTGGAGGGSFRQSVAQLPFTGSFNAAGGGAVPIPERVRAVQRPGGALASFDTGTAEPADTWRSRGRSTLFTGGEAGQFGGESQADSAEGYGGGLGAPGALSQDELERQRSLLQRAQGRYEGAWLDQVDMKPGESVEDALKRVEADIARIDQDKLDRWKALAGKTEPLTNAEKEEARAAVRALEGSPLSRLWKGISGGFDEEDVDHQWLAEALKQRASSVTGVIAGSVESTHLGKWAADTLDKNEREVRSDPRNYLPEGYNFLKAAPAEHPGAYAAGEVGTDVAQMMGLSKLFGAGLGAIRPLAKIPFAQGALGSGLTFGTMGALDAAGEGKSAAEVAQAGGIGFTGGAAGGALGQVASTAGGALLSKFGLAGSLPAQLANLGVSGAVFAGGDVGARYLLDPDYNPSADEVAQDMITAGLFSAVSGFGAARGAATAGKAAAASAAPASAAQSEYFQSTKTQEELKELYRALARANHPDVGGSAEAMARINTEYEALKTILPTAAQEAAAAKGILSRLRAWLGSFSAKPATQENGQAAELLRGTIQNMEAAAGASLPAVPQSAAAPAVLPLRFAGQDVRSGGADGGPAMIPRAANRTEADTTLPVFAAEQQKTASTGEAEPIRVGQRTVLKNQYTGETPLQGDRQTRVTPAVPDALIENAVNRITEAEQGAKQGGGAFKNLLTKAYEAVFRSAKRVPVDGLVFQGKQYYVDINNGVPGKVISDVNHAPEKLALLEMLPEIVTNGEFVGSTAGKKKVTRYDHFETPITISGRPYLVLFETEVYPGSNNYKTHRLINMELVQQSGEVTGTPPASPESAPAPSIPIIADSSVDGNTQSSQSGGEHTVGAAEAGFDPYTAAQNRYGTIPEGENPARMVDVPRQTTDGDRVSATARTAMEAAATPEGALGDLGQSVVDGKLSYIPVTNRETAAKAESAIRDKGFETALRDWTAEARSGKTSADTTAMGASLYNAAINAGDTKLALDILTDYARNVRSGAQAVQAARILKTLTPDGQLYLAQKSVQRIQEDVNKRFGDGKYNINIDPELADAYRKAEGEKARGEAMEAIYRDVAGQIPATWTDKWNAWRYFAMLGNPRTHIRNIAGNAGFVPIRVMKDIVAMAGEKMVNHLSPKGIEMTKAPLNIASESDRALIKSAWGDAAAMEEQILGAGKFSESADGKIEQGRTVFKTLPLEVARRANSKALDVEDTWFSRPAYAGALAGWLKANGITAEMLESSQSGTEKGTLTDDERGAILRYKSSESYTVNAKLRDGTELSAPEQRFVEQLTSALDKLSAYRGTVYRNLIFDGFGDAQALDAFLAQCREGSFFSGSSFISASTVENGYPVDGDYTVTLVIDGASARDVAGFGNNFENEVIFQRDADFLITKVETDSAGKPVVYMKEDAADVDQGRAPLQSLQAGQAVQPVQPADQGTDRVQQVSGKDSPRGAGKRGVRHVPAGGGTNQKSSPGLTPELLDKARAYAVREAQRATYRDANAFSDFVAGLRYRGDNPVGKAANVLMEGVLPFRRTPANILVRGVEYSPAGLLKGLTYDLYQVRAGKLTAAEAIDNISAGLVGTGLTALGALLASMGLVSGGSGDDDQDKQNDLTGGQPYALTIGEKNYTLDWLAPEALPFFVGVELWNASRENGSGRTMDDLTTALGSISEPMLEMSMLQSLQDAVDSVSYSDNKLMGILSSAATGYLTQAFPTLFGQLERLGESERQSTFVDRTSPLSNDLQYTLGRVMNKLPGEFQQTPYIDAWGRTESSGTLPERVAGNLLAPWYTSKENETDVDRELRRLHDAGLTGVYPQRASQSERVEGEYLSKEDYVTYAKTRGETSFQVVEDMLDSDAYRALSDEEKADAVKLAYQYAAAVGKMEVSEYRPDNWVKKAVEAERAGIEPADYILYRQMLPDGSVSMADAASVLEGADLERKYKGELWQLQSSQWGEEKNPFTGALAKAGVDEKTAVGILEKYAELGKKTYRDPNYSDDRMRQTELSRYLDGLGLTGSQRAAADGAFKFYTQIPAKTVPYSVETMSESAQKKWPDMQDMGLTEEEYLEVYSIYYDNDIDAKGKKEAIAQIVGSSIKAMQVYKALGKK